jgi:1,4-dihydroxy-2-naphthoate octaprenyltransferase
MISFFSYYVIAQEFVLVPLLIALTVGMNAMLMRLVDEMSGLEAHKKAGEKDLVVRYGVDGAANIMLGVMLAMYALCAVLCYFEPAFLLLFLTVPLALRAQRRLRDKSDRYRVMRPVLDILKLSMGHALLLVIALSMRIAWTSL